jgi:hypothetical protein
MSRIKANHWYLDNIKENIMLSTKDVILLRHHFEHTFLALGLDLALTMLGNYKSEQTAALWHEYKSSDAAVALITRARRKQETN